MYTPLRRLLFACVIAISLMQSACGQKGDLYLPEIPAAPNVMSDRPPSQATSRLEDQQQQEQSDKEKSKASAKKSEADAKAQEQFETQNSN